MYKIVGGEFTSTSFKTLASLPEVYGPYDTKEEAIVHWQGYAMSKVDNCLHRLFVVEDIHYTPLNCTRIKYNGPMWGLKDRQYKVYSETFDSFEIKVSDIKIFVPKSDCDIVL